jgi:hypothetical protein
MDNNPKPESIQRGGTQLVRRWLEVFQSMWVSQRSAVEGTWDRFSTGEINSTAALAREVAKLSEQWMVNAQRLWSLPFTANTPDANTIPTVAFVLDSPSDAANPKTVPYLAVVTPQFKFTRSIRVDNPSDGNHPSTSSDPLTGRLSATMVHGELVLSVVGTDPRSIHLPPHPGHYMSLVCDEAAEGRPVALVHVVIEPG